MAQVLDVFLEEVTFFSFLFLLHPIRTLSINSWKYAGAWLSPKETHLNSHFPVGTKKVDFALDSQVSLMW